MFDEYYKDDNGNNDSDVKLVFFVSIFLIIIWSNNNCLVGLYVCEKLRIE